MSLRLPEGRTLSDAATYTVVVNEFMATGGEGMGPPEGAGSSALDINDLDALIAYLKRLRAPVTAPQESRIIISQ